MENKTGCVIITTQEYKELIEDNMNKANCIKELNEIAFKRNAINEKLEKYFFDRLLDTESYHLENIKEFVPNDYNYQEVYQKFLDIGIDEPQYIHTSIMALKHCFDNKRDKEKSESEEE